MRKFAIVIACIMLITTFSCIFPIQISVAEPPGVPNSPDPANNSTDVSININLKWTCVDPDPGDKLLYDVYFGETSSPSKVSNNQSDFNYNPGPLAYTTPYYWKIVAWDKTNVSTIGPLWNFRTIFKPNQPPETPSDPNPSNGSSGISINAVLSWTCSDPDSDPLVYDVYFGISSTPPRVVNNQTATTYNPGTMVYGTIYYWKIVAWDNNSESQASSIWHFQTNNLPNQPSNPNPSNVSTNVPINTNLSWTGGDPDSGDTVTYDVYFGTSSNPPHLAFNQSDLVYDPTGDLVYNTPYYWRIVAWDNHGASTVGPLWSFTTGEEANQPPYVPSNPSPSDGFLGASIDVNLSWNGGDPDGDPVLYDVYFGISSSPPKIISNQSGTVYDPGTLDYVTVYYWRIIAWDNSSASTSGSIWNFTTKSESNHPPNIPTSPSPKNGSTRISVNADLSWTGGDPDPGDNVTYDVYFGTSSSPPKIVTKQITTSYDPGTLSYSTTYYWKIIAWDSQDNSTPSMLFHFTTTTQSGGGGGEEPPQEPQNIKPIADLSAAEPYQGKINSIILFDGSRSYDPDGNITSWFWDFGDNINANGESVSHSFLEAGTYTVTLIVTDNKGATDTDTTACVIRQSNRSPTKPTIAGPTSGTKNTVYIYTAASTDPDKDPLLYTFEWGGSISQLSGFLPNGMNYSVNHSWTTAGRYNLTVTVTDNQNNSTSMITIYIDAIQTRGAGYLFDNDGDGIYDAFYSDETHQTVSVQKKDDSYLIDKDGDGHWEYVYNATYGLTSYQEPRKTPGFDLVFTLGAIAVLLLLSRKRKTL